ncbi:hypothetical protein IWQ61_003739 [Dispira simplex]|nr:hypothetical protein IWQ61_003739 [Dispira simplex]
MASVHGSRHDAPCNLHVKEVPTTTTGPLETEPPPPYSSLYGEGLASRAELTKPPPHSSPAACYSTPSPSNFPTAHSTFHQNTRSSDNLPALENDHLIYGKMLDLEDLVSSVQHTLYSQSRAYHSVTTQLSEINQAISRLKPPEVQVPVTPITRKSNPDVFQSFSGKTEDIGSLQSLLAELDFTYSSLPLESVTSSPIPSPTAINPPTTQSDRSLSPGMFNPALNLRNPVSVPEHEEKDEDPYFRINDMLQSLIDDASDAIRSPSRPVLDDQDIAQAEAQDEYLGGYRKQLIMATSEDNRSSLPKAHTSPGGGTSTTGEDDTLAESDDNVEVQFWCKVVKKSRIIQDSLDKSRLHGSNSGSRSPLHTLNGGGAPQVISEHQLQNSLMIPLMTAVSPRHPLPSPFTPGSSTTAAADTTPGSVGRLRSRIRRSLIGTSLVGPTNDLSDSPLRSRRTTTDNGTLVDTVRQSDWDQNDYPNTVAAPLAMEDTVLAEGPQYPVKDTTKNFATMLYWTLLFTIGALLLDSFICNVAGHHVLGLIDHIHETQETTRRRRRRRDRRYRRIPEVDASDLDEDSYSSVEEWEEADDPDRYRPQIASHNPLHGNYDPLGDGDWNLAYDDGLIIEEIVDDEVNTGSL